LGFLHSARLDDIRKVAVEVQNDLLSLGAVLSEGKNISDDKIDFWENRVRELEEVVDYFEEKNEPLETFILPGGCRESSFLHLARVTCRRLERIAISYLGENKNKMFVIKYLNRLSDLLFVMARYSNKKLGFKDIIWKNKDL
jgi:cob(I)alamin adenosyltransferase